MKKLKKNKKIIIPVLVSILLVLVMIVMGIVINEKNNTMISPQKQSFFINMQI